MTETVRLEKSHFAPLVGQTFRIAGKDMILAKVSDCLPTPEEFREPFSLIFECEDEAGPRSDVVPVEHDEIGSYNLLVTRVMGQKPSYQVIFN